VRWRSGKRSRNLEDRRAQQGARRRTGGLPIGRGGAGLGIGGVVILIAIGIFFGPEAVLGLLSGGGQISTGGAAPSTNPGDFNTTAAEEELVDFVSFVLDDAQSLWQERLPGVGSSYRDAKLVLFREAVESRCGFAKAQSGPFYCPGDERVYIDLSFYEDLKRRYGAPGDFAQAYVLAHEIGHHVQTVVGTERQVRTAQRENPALANQLSVLVELQADCYAGVWAHSTRARGILDAGDLEEGMSAAAAVGDDRLQQQSQGRVNPDAFTHGTSAQRVEWFRRGLKRGNPADCDTFNSVER
jgi:predicted metalloprotease